MENPFEIIEQRLKNIEKQLSELVKMVQTPIFKGVTEEIMRVEQLSDYLTIARQTIYEKCSKKEIPYFKAGKRLYFKKSVINDWINSGRRYTTDELMQQAVEWARKHPRKL
ncbi:MAG: helix-turn-helix domain-containing protein [Paludibacter sp.]|nr:helix-turn-helix domain-containing protein [Paludibacter sp.]